MCRAALNCDQALCSSALDLSPRTNTLSQQMKPSRLLATLCLLLMTVGSVSFASASEPVAAEVARVTGDHLQVGVDKTSGQIVEFVDLASKHNFAGRAPQIGGLWQIELANRVTLTATNARRLEILPQPENPAALRLRWSEFVYVICVVL